MVRDELINLLGVMGSTRYRTILKILGDGLTRLEIIEDRYVSDTVLSNLLNTLVNMSIVERRDGEYAVIDPIYAAAA
ncbi:hypothetical protein [Vulcanisaeta sp. JCM 16159]|uniref:hypothetical protein n=1 Tax=Vulcanisaeta sp. JCM 16159 TaxID=1295371 RepID=UPI000AE01849|nr:hypothetical protein [Vulcanisaeta sp. JCM 16159]